MRKTLILSLIFALAACQTYSTTVCECSQLLSDSDCLKNSNCQWDITKKTCASATTPVTPVETYATYCQDFSETDCPKAKPCETCGTYSACQWLDKKCSHFTGCTAHQKTTDGDCQAISNRCITDGTHCVELGTCDSYLKQQPCVKNSSGRFCYWNTTDNKCEDASTCDKLPITLNTDALCRAQLSTCTTTATGGCVDSGTGCADQKLESQCVWNKIMSQACYWTGTECKDKICDNAPLTMTTDDACKNFVSTCTAKQGGGCITRTTCANAVIQAACIKSSGGVDCYWTGTACLDKICTNAPKTMTTNTACAGYKSNCITTNGGGCVDNGNCSAANIAAACSKNIYGVECIFDNNICKEKICTNAPTTNNTHELCQSFLSSCTVKAGGGCQPKTCSNAPTSITSNTDCENYLPKYNCIAKLNGGCETLSYCTSITLEANCVKDVSGSACIFNGSCKYKTCGNSPAANDTHELCQTYLSSCTAVDGKCIDKTCENSLTEAICTTDLNNKACQWRGKCFQKQCAYASTEFTLVSDCRNYKSLCTLSNTGNGCIDMPLRCEAFTSQATCSFRRNDNNGVVTVVTCGWNGTTCVDKSCATAPKDIIDQSGCEGYLDKCVLSNTGAGCQDLPKTCAARKLQAICDLGFDDPDPNCVWNANTNSCVDDSCAMANVDGIVGKIAEVNVQNCNDYFGCLVSNDGTSGCITKPASCAGLGEPNCGKGSKIGGDCVYIGGQCKDLTCVNLNYNTQADCAARSCSVKNDKNGCQPFQALCTAYTIQENCVKNASNKPCKWNSITTKCEETSCLDAPKTDAYNTDAACSAFSNSSGICTVIARVQVSGGCALKQTSCQLYKTAAECHKTLLNSGVADDCEWDAVNSVCIVKAGGGVDPPVTLTCAQLSLLTYSNDTCAAAKSSCKANSGGTACENKVCADYSAGITTAAQCKEYDSTCTIDNGGATRTCQTTLATCSHYGDEAKCTFSQAGACYFVVNCYALAAVIDCTKWKGTDAHCREYSSKCKGAATPGNDVACVAKGCTEASGKNLGWTGCQGFGTSCSSNVSLDSCVDKQDACSSYTTLEACVQTSATAFCDWNGSGCEDFASDALCTSIVNVHAKIMCEYKSDGRCTYLSDGGGCQTKESTCSTYTTSAQCTVSIEGACFFNASLAAGSQCFHPTTPTTDCSKIMKDQIQDIDCESLLSGCLANRNNSGCCERKEFCNLYTNLVECKVANDGFCVQSQALNNGATCMPLTDQMTCAQIFPGEGLANHEKCNFLRSECTNNGPNACGEKTCANAINAQHDSYTAAICEDWKSGCVPNNSNSGCITKPSTCAEQTVATCTLSTEGFCHVVNNKCTLKSCQEADSGTNTTHANCESFLSVCTIARLGGCQSRVACNSYISEIQCKFNTTGAECHWNVIGKTCVDKKCDNYEAASFDTAAKCEAKGCVVKQAGSGCQNKGTCGSYNEIQCTATSTNSSGGSCVWNTNLETPACQDKSCATAPNTTASVTECNQYFNGCTVAVTIDAATNAATYGGCIPRAACNTYIAEDQCDFNAEGGKCGWNGEKCDDFSCLTAPAADHTTHEACAGYKSGCTVNSTLEGCIEIPDKCEGMIKEQCLFDKNDKECYWIEESSSCITKTCDNAPSTILDAAGCEEYLSGCTMADDIKCKTKVCEDFVFTTDALCKGAMSTCTSDGSKCVLRGTCAQALSQAGCVTAVNGQECEWLTTSTGASYCTNKNCTTAPTSLTTEAQCASYYPGCTTKNNGGCVVKTTCAAANTQSACTKSSLGVECAWDVDKCRDKDCQDFSGKTHAECKSLRSNCTAGLNGKCARLSTCENASVHAACVEGMNGPCLWIGEACYSYTSCQSLTWPSNSQCKQISSQCTTDGTKCVGITSCAETNVNGGCVTGYDGECIQSVPALDSTETKCKLYTSCAVAFYLTHVQCQTASYKCTTNKQTGCIPLAACSTYTVDESCKINDKGTVLTNNKVTSTGYCTWDATASTCRDQVCSDLIYTTHSACNSTLSTCTSDGTACLNQGNCSTYTTDAACNNGVGLDGVCFWVAQNGTTAASCRLKTCDDVQNGTSNSVCSIGLSSCISDGTKCIPYSTCSSYNTQASCNTGGSDGTCVWKSTTTGTTTTGTCSLMTSCASASSDQTACTAAKFKCQWTPAVTGTKPVASKCETHTCASYKQTNGSCSRFFSWDSKLQQICTTVNGVCQATDPATLTQGDCYSSQITGYAYTWNAATSKCGVCTSAPVTTNNTTNIVNNTTTTESGYIVSIFIMALSYILI